MSYVSTEVFDIDHDKHTAKCVYCGCDAKYECEFDRSGKEEWYECSCKTANRIAELDCDIHNAKVDIRRYEEEMQRLRDVRSKGFKVFKVTEYMKSYGVKLSDIQ